MQKDNATVCLCNAFGYLPSSEKNIYDLQTGSSFDYRKYVCRAELNPRIGSAQTRTHTSMLRLKKDNVFCINIQTGSVHTYAEQSLKFYSTCAIMFYKTKQKSY